MIRDLPFSFSSRSHFSHMSSKHANAGLLIQRGLYDDLHSFSELELRISNLGDENTKIVGDAFEVFVEGYLATHQKLQAATVWLVGQVPLDIRQQLNLPRDTKGIDGVFRTRTGTLVPYQVKFRSHRAYLTYTEIASFLGLTERATDRIVFTNSNELAEDVKNRDAMRTVRGIDFDDLTEDDFRAICGWLKKQPVAIPKPTPYPYQISALEKIRETFTKSDRAHVVMACGTGKTLVALWAVEQLKPKTILVLVPSLTLLQQTLDEWSRHNSWGNAFSYICVCSDPTVASKDENDPITFHRSDAEFRVDTDPDVVRRFIKRDGTSIKVIFSTYQSSAVVAEGMRGLPPLGIGVFDEAHKTTGPQGGIFAHSLSDNNIEIRKRLFFTATPRHYDIRHRDRQGDFRINSMDNETVYGPRAYTLTFGSAARQGIICDYKVVISMVDGHEVNDFALKHGITLVAGDLIGAKWVANQIAVERAIEQTGAIRGITFHSRVSSAKEFSADTSRGIQQWLPDFSVFHVNGDQKSSERKQLIRSFREATNALITNARCLTEGIDVPAVDMVAFIDPRHSRIDIAQATGRAMRKPQGSAKTIGYVVIPLFLERKIGETLEEALERSEFDDVALVLNAMQEQDDDLAQIVRELQVAKGRGEIFNPRKLLEKIEVLGPSIELSTLKARISAEIIDHIGRTWDEMFGRLVRYKQEHGNANVIQKYDLDEKLGHWVQHQRRFKRMNLLSEVRTKRLEELGFEWEFGSTIWDKQFRELVSYKKHHGHTCVSRDENKKLGAWVQHQRQFRKRNELAPARISALDEIGFDWDPYNTDWEEGFRHLVIYNEREGHCLVPIAHNEANGFRLGVWVRGQRVNIDDLSDERRQRLNELGFSRDPLLDRWAEGFHHLKTYIEREGHCRVPNGYKEKGFPLQQWVQVQRSNRDDLSDERRQRLNEFGFVLDPREALWEEGFRHLMIYKKREGHCLVPQGHDEGGFRLGSWVSRQRDRATIKKVSSERRQRLNELGFVWEPLKEGWEKGVRHLMIYREREGHCAVPSGHLESGFPLGTWVTNQRPDRNQISPKRRQLLDELGFVWELRKTSWEEGLNYLKIYRKREGHCHVPIAHLEDGYPLGQWVGKQRSHKDTISVERRQSLEELGVVWNVLSDKWEKGLSYLKLYKDREGHCRVPYDHNEKDFRLGQWVTVQRSNKETISDERRNRLDELDFVWNLLSDQWEEGLNYLKKYREREGHCRVPDKHMENDFKLGLWVGTQRQKKAKMPAERRQRLDALGFVWKVR
jgi:superfamily II DNA or RNA helicase